MAFLLPRMWVTDPVITRHFSQLENFGGRHAKKR
jgi:hypothetical protein